jgi:hypothetical protein
MRKNLYVYIFIIVFIVVVTTIVAVKFTLITASIFITLSGWFSFAVRHLYSKWEWFYLNVQKIKFTVLNPDTLWNMTIRYQCDVSNEKINDLRNAIIDNKGLNNIKLYDLPSGDLEIRADKGINLQLFYNEKELEIFINDLPVTYNYSLEIIEKILNPLLEEIESIVIPFKRTYILKVSLNGSNPYFGLYINKVPSSSVINFDIKFIVESNQVEINKDSVILTSDSKSILTNLSRDYLTLSVKK